MHPKLLSGAEQDVIIKELLAGHGQNGVPQLPWPESLSLALGTRGFRQEIRQLFDRVIELGLAPADLEDLGHRYDQAGLGCRCGTVRRVPGRPGPADAGGL